MPKGESGKGGSDKLQIKSAPDKHKTFDELMGVEYSGYKGQAAIDKLMEEKQGHIKDAFYHPEIGGVDLFWGDETAGLCHIVIERKNQGLSGLKFVKTLPDVIENGRAFEGKDSDRVNIAYKGKIAVIVLELRGTETTALLSAFHTKK